MTEEDARTWMNGQLWSRPVVTERIETFVQLVLEEADNQNLISAASREEMWARHIVDSAQLLTLADRDPGGHWVDLGTGAGFPGMVIACIRPAPITLIEMRPLRAAFLARCAKRLELDHVTVVTDKVERVGLDSPAAFISARAYAPLNRLLESARHLSDSHTRWLLPKGRKAASELEEIRPRWDGMFHVEQSLTDPESAIAIIDNLARRTGRHTRDRVGSHQASKPRQHVGGPWRRS